MACCVSVAESSRLLPCRSTGASHLLPVLGQEHHMRQVVGVQAGGKAAQHVEHVPAVA